MICGRGAPRRSPDIPRRMRRNIELRMLQHVAVRRRLRAGQSPPACRRSAPARRGSTPGRSRARRASHARPRARGTADLAAHHDIGGMRQLVLLARTASSAGSDRLSAPKASSRNWSCVKPAKSLTPDRMRMWSSSAMKSPKSQSGAPPAMLRHISAKITLGNQLVAAAFCHQKLGIAKDRARSSGAAGRHGSRACAWSRRNCSPTPLRAARRGSRPVGRPGRDI